MSSSKKLVIKAFDKDYNLIPYAIYEDDFTVTIPEDCTLKKIVQKKKKHTIQKINKKNTAKKQSAQ